MKKYKIHFTSALNALACEFESSFPDFASAVGFALGIFNASNLKKVVVYDCDTSNFVLYEREIPAEE